MENMEVVDFTENRFEIRADLELIFQNNIFHLISESDYVIFKDIDQFVKADDINYFIKQDTSIITINSDDYLMIQKAVDMCKRGEHE